MPQSWNDYIQDEELANEGKHIFKSLKALYTLIPDTDDVKISIQMIDKLPDEFEDIQELNKPLRPGDVCFLYAQGAYLVECEEVKS